MYGNLTKDTTTKRKKDITDCDEILPFQVCHIKYAKL